MAIIIFILDKLFLIVALLAAIIIHEYFHGFTAAKLGDPTAFEAGRLSFNPLVHIDLVGTIIVPIGLLIISGGTATIGWAKPVPINALNFDNPRQDMAKVALAGPGSNFAIATIAALLLRLGGILPLNIISLILSGQSLLINPFLSFLAYLIFINLILGVFNLIPIPPLDGSHILQAYLPREIAYKYRKIEPYGMLIILALFFFFNFFGKVILPLVGAIIKVYSIH
jgi:Zn-dependent protease